jgi:hypothetical protein
VASFGECHPSLKRPKVLEDEPSAYAFLDGDFIELLLELPSEAQHSVVNDAQQRLSRSMAKCEGYGEGPAKMDLKQVRGLVEHLRQGHQ